MKKFILLTVFLISGLLFEKTFAQVILSVNIVSQPIWGPVGYDYVDYYYLPDIDTYYYVPTQRFIYLYDEHWISRPALPARYKGYNLYNTRKVVINEPKPYLNNQNYRVRYESSNEFDNQKSIRDSQDIKYFVIKNHPKHSQWRESNEGQNHPQKKTIVKSSQNKHGKSRQGKNH